MLKHFATAALLTATTPALAQTLDFDSLTPASGRAFVNGPFAEDGFTLTADRCSTSGTCFVTQLRTQSIDTTGASLANFVGNASTTVMRTGGGAFTLNSIDFSEVFDDGSFGPGTASAQFRFNFADGTIGTRTETFNTRGRFPRSTLTFDLAPLSSFAFSPAANTSGFLQFDNIVLSPAASAVPEPATWAMLLLGFGMTGRAMRRSRHRAGQQFARV